MRAKEYAKPVIETNSISEFKILVAQAAGNMLSEMGELIKSRNVKTDDGLIGCMKQTDAKMKAFTKIVNQKNQFNRKALKDGMFLAHLKEIDTELYSLYYESMKSK